MLPGVGIAAAPLSIIYTVGISTFIHNARPAAMVIAAFLTAAVTARTTAGGVVVIVSGAAVAIAARAPPAAVLAPIAIAITNLVANENSYSDMAANAVAAGASGAAFMIMAIERKQKPFVTKAAKDSSRSISGGAFSSKQGGLDSMAAFL